MGLIIPVKVFRLVRKAKGRVLNWYMVVFSPEAVNTVMTPFYCDVAVEQPS